MLFTFELVNKLSRKDSNTYLGVFSLGVVKSWNLPIVHADRVNDDIIIVNYEKYIGSSKNEIKVSEPVLIYKVPIGGNNDEYPVLFYEKNEYFPNYTLNQLINFEPFGRLIEKGERISSNSTKLMTIKSLRDMIEEFGDYQIDQEMWPELSENLIVYVHSLIKCFPELGYLPVAERKKFRKVSIADSTIAWSCYLRYFIEEWNVIHSVIEIPDLLKIYLNKDWSGKFFDRNNPVLSINNGKFKFNNSHRDLIYAIWREWIREA
ncbi:hypothetical protein MHH60_20390 [Paenibacillus sp. FSL H7-0716]|uniref:Uncharacterized protein n=1 Tax=Paenibacillus odorifer TaxID=189426 RepID=A0AB36JEB1_9BACL|nr:hypothetical protein [Paenibacillus odorifer]OME16565.1 hypothetical protein BSK47_20105 [Paenibacillus odorifer]